MEGVSTQIPTTTTNSSNPFIARLKNAASSAASSVANKARGAAYKLSGKAPLEDDYLRVNNEIQRLYDAYIVKSGLATITDKNKLLKDREYINDRALDIIERRLNYLNGSSVTDKSKIPGVKDSLEKAKELKPKIDEKLKVMSPGLFDEITGNFKEQKKYDSSSSFVGPTLTYAIASAMSGLPGGGGKRRHKRSRRRTKKLNKRKTKTHRRKSKTKGKSRKNK